MKKIALLFTLFSVALMHGQKKKTSSTTATVLAKSGNASVVFNKKKDLYLVVAVDSMLLAKSKPDFNPTNVKLTPVKVKANNFYNVSWSAVEKTETKLKKEVSNITENQLWNPTTKTLLIGNTQKAVDITEIEFLDRLKTASQTVYRKRSEGYLFTLLANGEFTLSNKTSNTKYAYNEKSQRYEPVKK